MNGLKNVRNPHLAEFMLRAGLAFVFGYAGFSSLHEPLAWASYLPHFLAVSAQAVLLVKLFGFFELVLALWLLWGKWVRYAAIAAFALLAGIVVLNPDALSVTFRDIGLAAMAAALFFVS